VCVGGYGDVEAHAVARLWCDSKPTFREYGYVQEGDPSFSFIFEEHPASSKVQPKHPKFNQNIQRPRKFNQNTSNQKPQHTILYTKNETMNSRIFSRNFFAI